MVNPVKAVGRAFEPIISATSRALTLPGAPQATAAPAPTIPPAAPEATSPTAKPKRKGQQESFLSGVAASALGGQSGSTSGKTLLGA